MSLHSKAVAFTIIDLILHPKIPDRQFYWFVQYILFSDKNIQTMSISTLNPQKAVGCVFPGQVRAGITTLEPDRLFPPAVVIIIPSCLIWAERLTQIKL